MKELKIKCNECNCDIDMRQQEAHTRTFYIDHNKYIATYFKCPKCGKYYLVEVLDNYARKLKDKYIRIFDSVNLKKQKKLPVSDQRLQELQEAKEEAVNYQKLLVADIEDKIPSTVFNDGNETNSQMEEN